LFDPGGILPQQIHSKVGKESRKEKDPSNQQNTKHKNKGYRKTMLLNHAPNIQGP
jgi:hypothetical protein